MVKRMSLILPEADAAGLEPFLHDGTPQRSALAEWAAAHGREFSRTEAAILRLLLAAGVESVSEAALDIAYGQLAATFDSEDMAQDRRAARDRYAARHREAAGTGQNENRAEKPAPRAAKTPKSPPHRRKPAAQRRETELVAA
jgi:hypothetical protein